MNAARSKQAAFTIVELLIVIIVIAVLAVIAIVAYSGIQSRARTAAVQTDLSNAKKQMMLAQVDAGTFPTDTASLKAGNGTTYELSVINTANPQTFCMTGTNGNISYKVTESSVPVQGSCPGHGSNGIAAITNLSQNPKGVGTAGWFRKATTSTQTDTPNESWGPRTDWHRFIRGTDGTFRMDVPLSSLTDGHTYAMSVLVANPGTVNVSVNLDFSDRGGGNFVIAPGEMRRIGSTGSRLTYDSTFRFFDVTVNTSTAEGLLVSDAMITEGPTIYNYADGNSPNWIWNGAANASSSTGPPV